MRRHTRSGATILVALSLVALGCGEKAPSAPIIGSSGAGSAQIALTRRADTVAVDESVQLSAIIPSAPGTVTPSVSWSTSDPNVAIVTQNGVVFALKSGRTTVTVTARGYSDATTVTVRPSVREVTFDNDSLAISLAQSVQLPYRVTDSDGNQVDLSQHKVEWSSTDPTVAGVTSDATVTGRAIGSADLLLRVDNKVAKTGVRVLSKPVASVFASPSSLALAEGQTAQLVATTYDVNGDPLKGRKISWSSSNSSVATVSSSGLVTTIASGNANVTASVEGRTSIVPVTVSAASNVGATPVASVVVALNAPTLIAGQSTQATASLKDASGNVLTDRSIVWTSSEVTVASVNATGLVTALKGGAVTITAASEGKSGGASLITAMPATTAAPVSVVTLTVVPSLNVGQTAQASVTLKDASGNVLTGRTVNWVSSDESIVSVSSSGVVTALKGGGVTITASVDGGASASAVVSAIAPKPAVTSMALSAGTTQLKIGQLTQISAVVRDANGNILSNVPVTFSSTPSTVATVSGSGMTAGVSVGSAMVYAKADTVVRSIGVTVIDTATAAPPPVVAVTSVTVGAPLTSLAIGQTTEASVTLRDASGNTIPTSSRTIGFSSSNPAIASVSGSGTITGIGVGSVVISASSEGVTGTLAVTVTASAPPPPPPPTVATVSVTLSASSLVLGQTTQAAATARDGSGTAIADAVITWSSSNPSVATVSGSGLVTAVGGGTAAIVATSDGKTGSQTLSVTVPPPPPSPAGIAILPGESIQAKVDANPAGTTFILKSGTHVRQSVVPKDGNVFRGEPGTVLDGQNATAFAFRGWNGSRWINSVTVRNLSITRYTPPAQNGAIWGGDDQSASTTGWTLDSLDVHHNANLGIRIGNRMKVLRSQARYNGTVNIGGVGRGVLVDGFVSTFGNNGCVNNPGFESGGSKFVKTDSLIVRNSTFSDNCGVGLWLDINNVNYQLYNNLVERNYREGICVEVSFGGKIYNNTVNANGWPVDAFRPNTYLWDAGIGVHASPDVEVYGNTLNENFNGIVIIQQKRDASTGDSYAPAGGFIAQNVYVHDNIVYQRTPAPNGDGGASGAANDAGDTATFTSRNNRWVRNTYYTGTNARAFAWMNGFRTAAEWRAYGQDTSGSLNP